MSDFKKITIMVLSPDNKGRRAVFDGEGNLTQGDATLLEEVGEVFSAAQGAARHAARPPATPEPPDAPADDEQGGDDEG